MPETHLFVRTTIPNTAVAQVSASHAHVHSWAQSQERFPERDVSALSAHRRLEHFALDQLMLTFDGPLASAQIIHDTQGKPHLFGNEGHISLAHHTASNCCWAMISVGSEPIGCDIERPRQQLQSIRKRFLNDRERKNLVTTEQLCCAWGIKESMFKSIGANVDFRQDLEVGEFQIPEEETFIVSGTIRGVSSNWQVWKVRPDGIELNGTDLLFAVTGPIQLPKASSI